MPHRKLDYINRLASIAVETRSPDPFETFVRSHLFQRAREPKDTSSLELNEALFACEVLGALATWGSQAPRNWWLQRHALRNAGFEIFSTGEARVIEFVSTLISTQINQAVQNWMNGDRRQKINAIGVPRVLGEVSRTLSRRKSNGAMLWITGVIAHALTQNKILTPGSSYLGYPAIETPYRTLLQAAGMFSMTPHSLRSALRELDVIDTDQDRWVNDAIWIDIEKHQPLLETLASSKSMVEAAKYLRVDVALVAQLEQDETLQPILFRSSADGKRLVRFAIADLDHLAGRLTHGAQTTGRVIDTSKHCSIGMTAMRVGRSPAQIVDVVLSGRLKNTLAVERSNDVKNSILLDIEEVRAHVRLPESDTSIGMTEAAKQLHIDPAVLRTVMRSQGILFVDMLNPVNGRRQMGISLTTMRQFAETYVSLNAIAAHLSLPVPTVKKHLNALGIKPAIAQRALFFERHAFLGTKFEMLAEVGSESLAAISNGKPKIVGLDFLTSATVEQSEAVHTDLTDSEWSTIQPLLTTPVRDFGVDERKVINGILWRLRSQASWTEIPERYGPSPTCFNRFYRWRKSGLWDLIIVAVAKAYEGNVEMIEASAARVGRSHRTRVGIDLVAWITVATPL